MPDQIETKLAIFDLGNVVYRIDWQPMFESWSEASHVPAENLKQKFKFDENYEAFERGELGSAEFHQRLCHTLFAEFSYNDFVRGWNAIFQEAFNGIGPNLRLLGNKMQVVAFTNTNEVHHLLWSERYREVLMNFEHIFVSFQMGVRKPEVEGFTRILDHYRVKPDQTVFFDDFEPNIKGAKNLGIRSFLVDSPEVVSSFVNKLGS